MVNRLALIGAFVAAVAVPMPSQAAANVALSLPGAALAGYATPAVVGTAAAAFTLVNADPLAAHDFVAKATGPDDQPWCVEDVPCPLFWSATIVAGETTEVLGLENATSGTTYDFYCTLHPATMNGTLVVV